MAEYTLGEDVYQDMEDIWEYIAQGSPGAARRWTTELLICVKKRLGKRLALATSEKN